LRWSAYLGIFIVTLIVGAIVGDVMHLHNMPWDVELAGLLAVLFLARRWRRR
jgi:hypothetical protein